ncbi:hypothetical protein ACSHT0_11010 [Tepidicaulis sp. LMO-SS28]|uniref:hypothetical protein n=1 Tax=Tepidicaulis sp. LMO-SS28 TaxID=3447455 RepID=UPI003EE17D56
MSGQNPKDEKKARLEEALRANLRRRKAQMRGRKAGVGQGAGQEGGEAALPEKPSEPSK